MLKTRIKRFLKKVCENNIAQKPINKSWKEAEALKIRWAQICEIYLKWGNDIKDSKQLLNELNDDFCKQSLLQNNFTFYEQKTLRRLLRKSELVKF